MKGGLLTHLLITKEMSVEEIYANATEMLLAGVDTVRACVAVFKCEGMCARRGLRRGAVSVALAGGGGVGSCMCVLESVLSFRGWVSGAISVPV